MKKIFWGIIIILSLQIVSAKQNFDYDLNADDSLYDDPITLEFCLQNTKGQKFCIYHNIRKIKNFDYENYEIFKDWSSEDEIIRWDKQITNAFSITWNHTNGAILYMETNSSDFKTNRGVKVGDPISKVEELYGADSNISRYDSETKKYKTISSVKGKKFHMLISEKGYSINAGNLIDEEMMVLMFHCKDGKISKIEFGIGN